MATLSNQSGRRMLQFGSAGNRKTIRLGKMDAKTAQSVRTHIERILVAKSSGQPVPMETASWLGAVGNELHAKLSKHGLVSPRESEPVSDTSGKLYAFGVRKLVDTYIARRTDLKPRTIANLKQTANSLAAHFGKNRDYRTINEGEAIDWKRSMNGKLAGPTIAMHVKKSREIFKHAKKHKLIADNPFADLRAGSMKNKSRNVYIPASDVLKVIDACPDVEWRLIFALARFAGLRTPSEMLPLKWNEIFWNTSRMIVHSPKTEHHEGGEMRTIPIFPELRRWLEEAQAVAEEGNGHVIQQHRWVSNWRTRAQKIIARAGIKAWPRLFQNLRSSCETDLATRLPLHVACEWIGNSELIAARHYLKVTDEHYRQGSGEGAVKSAADSAGLRRTDSEQSDHENAETALLTRFPVSPIPPRVGELPADSRGKQQSTHKALQKALHIPGGVAGRLRDGLAKLDKLAAAGRLHPDDYAWLTLAAGGLSAQSAPAHGGAL